MKVSVEPELCIACGLCVSLCPEVFDWGDHDKAVSIVDEVPSDQEDCAKEAIEGCPTDAIKEIVVNPT